MRENGEFEARFSRRATDGELRMHYLRNYKLRELEESTGASLNAGDVPILAAAINHCDLLVTGDFKHFGPWMGKTVEGLQVMSLALVIELLTEKT
jgi:hypothetical protein